MKTRDGTTHYLRCSGMPLHDPQGNFSGYRGTGQDITAQRHIRRKAEFMALHDPLTGLPNRAAMSEAANASIRSRRPFALLLSDLDRFKLINQSLGQQIGDQLLREVASRLNCLPGDDAVYCLGGDEFVMLLSSGPLIAAERGIDAVASVVEAIDRPYHVAGLTLSSSCSIGLAIFPEDGATLSDILKNADVALVDAKKQTGSSFCRYAASLQAGAIDLDRLQMENDLLEAFAAQRLQLHYQPRVWLQSGTMAGMEVLLRWTDPKRGAVSPRDFIPLAEQSGLILALGEWVMESACRQAKAWEAHSGQRLLLAVNVSPRQLNRGFPGVVQRVLAETGLTPQSLELDITEDALMVNTAEAIEVMDDITRLGVSLALDDFGTGYSSLTHLKRCPFEALKLAPSFVAGVVERENDRVIVRSVITMAHGLGLRAVAEGVETEAQRQVLQDLGCDEYQGYLKSPPLDAESFAARLLHQVA
jgi:diguanylate cyclase (GGDEF)-like protein